MENRDLMICISYTNTTSNSFNISDIESQTYNSALVGAAMEKKVTMICIIIGITIAILFVLIR